MLQMEESKALKKIDETRVRAKKLLEMKKATDRKYEMKARQD